MSDEEKKELQELINLLYNGHISQYGKRKLEVYIKKQQKEIEELSTYREIDKFDELAKKCINVNAELFYYKINELVKAVNSIRKDKNND